MLNVTGNFDPSCVRTDNNHYGTSDLRKVCKMAPEVHAFTLHDP